MSAIAVGERHLGAPSAVRTRVEVAALAVAVCASAWVALGAAGSTYLLRLATSANPHWIYGPLRGLGGSLGPTSLSVGLVLLLASYLVALACVATVPMRLTLGAVALANLAFTLAPSLVSTDVYGYIAYAREATAHGLNPYVSAPSSIPHDAIFGLLYWRFQTSPYGPLFTGLSLPLGLTSPALALWIFKAAAGAASVGLAWLAARVASDRALSPARAAVLVGMNPVLLFYAVSGAHNDLLAALLLTAAIALLIRDREAVAAAASIGALAVKVTLGLALPFVLIAANRRRSAARGAALALIAIGIPTLLLFGTHILDQVRRISSDGVFDIAFSGPDRIARLLGTHIGTAVRVTCTGAAAAVAVAMIARTWHGRDWVTHAGWAFLALLASIASLAPWYLVWLLPFAAVSSSRSLRAATLLATAYLITVHLPILGGQPWLTPP